MTRYLDEGVTAIHGSYSVKRKSILDPYIGEFNVFLDKGSTVCDASIGGTPATDRHGRELCRIGSASPSVHS
ncbi:MAG TPA: hypothetical protein VFC84_00790 [Desulfosporosinus sp.]|nr:hypothetical protein [Desulfosporosinus sp.]